MTESGGWGLTVTCERRAGYLSAAPCLGVFVQRPSGPDSVLVGLRFLPKFSAPVRYGIGIGGDDRQSRVRPAQDRTDRLGRLGGDPRGRQELSRPQQAGAGGDGPRDGWMEAGVGQAEGSRVRAGAVRIIREKGTNRSRFFRGMVEKYTWVALGSSYVTSDIPATFLLGQLEQRALVQARRRRRWETYDRDLRDVVAAAGGRTPTVSAGSEHAYHRYCLFLPDRDSRQALIAHLCAAGITAVFHYLPLHLSEMGRCYGGRSGDCPVSEDVGDRLVRLPFYFTLAETEQARVCHEVAQFLSGQSGRGSQNG